MRVIDFPSHGSRLALLKASDIAITGFSARPSIAQQLRLEMEADYRTRSARFSRTASRVRR